VTQISITEAQLHLPELIANLQPGDEVQIFSGDRPVAKLVGEPLPPRQPRQPGSAIGTFSILSDDTEHLNDFENYMP